MVAPQRRHPDDARIAGLVGEQGLAVRVQMQDPRGAGEGLYSSYLEQLDAQRALLNSDLTLAQIQGERLSACVALYQALGGGWDQSDVQRAGPTVKRP